MPTPKLLLIDGYNVIHRIPELKQGLSVSLENSRQKLALMISGWKHGHPGTECVIVFDGEHQISGGPNQRLAGIPCRFTRTSHGADAEIIRIVREHRGDKSEIAVVSDDNSIRNSCRAHGAAVQPSSFLSASKLGLFHGKTAPRISTPSVGNKVLNRKAAADINEELKKKFGI